jgi:DNA-binding transcriptional ArsR family regulator
VRTIVTTNVFLAISDPTRRAVLDLLAGGSRNAGAIAARFPRLTQPGVSRHLKVLREARLVDVTVHAQQRIYAIRPEGLAELYEWIAKYQAMWPDTLSALERYLDARAAGEKPKGKKR